MLHTGFSISKIRKLLTLSKFVTNYEAIDYNFFSITQYAGNLQSKLDIGISIPRSIFYPPPVRSNIYHVIMIDILVVLL